MKRTTVPLGIAAALLVVTALFAGRFHHRGAADPTLPDVTLRATDGHDVALSGYRGRWLLVYFGYTHCHGDCTAPLRGMKEAVDARKDVTALFVTLDPGRDTEAALAAFVRPFAPEVTALTGGADAIAAAERVFGVYAVPHDTPQGVHYDRSNGIYVVDPRGRLAGHVDGLAPPGIISSSIGKPVP